MILSNFFRTVAVAAIALSLASCGGKATFPINGKIATVTTTTGTTTTTSSTLLYDGLVLQTNGMTLTVPKNATAFSFPNTISYGETYAVTVAHKPDHQTCTTVDQSTALETANGTAGLYAAINISLTCFLDTYTIGGAVNNLTATGLVLINGTSGGQITVVPGVTTYSFSNLVSYGSSYGVTILTQPTGQTCTVSNPVGIMGDAAVTNIDVTCV